MNIDIKTADGEEIEFGGSYYDGRGTEHRVVGIRLTDYRHITKVSLSCLVGKVEDLCCVSMRPNELYSTPPDSWEKLEEDLDSCSASTRYAPCAYFSFSSDSCEKCPADPNKECLVQMVKHIAPEMQQGKYQGLRTFYVSCLGCGARTDLEYAEEFAADLWNERVSYFE